MKPCGKNEMLINIQNMLHNNGFPLQLIDKFQKSRKTRLANKKLRVILATKERGLHLPYLVAKNIILHNFCATLRVAYKTKNSIQLYLKTTLQFNNKDKLKKKQRLQLTCSDCGKLYTGQTGRSVNTRFKEYFLSFKNNNYNSKFSHVLEKKIILKNGRQRSSILRPLGAVS